MGSLLTFVGQVMALTGRPVRQWAAWESSWNSAYDNYVGVILRAKKEDEYLREAFKDEWEEWARRVSYMFLPGIH